MNRHSKENKSHEPKEQEQVPKNVEPSAKSGKLLTIEDARDRSKKLIKEFARRNK